ncbi:transposase family protein [Streptomyces sp. NPDC057486]|uniref:transposase family protein n=1 Tax=Streptomyces sp. NPDC057486 TaxID=3346145 RepID=UPI0036C3D029
MVYVASRAAVIRGRRRRTAPPPSRTASRLRVSAVACGPPPRCPGCRSRARRVHSTYERGLAERPLTGQKLQIGLRVRRFFCDRSSCRRRTFVEQVDGLSERYQRSSFGTRQWLRAVAVELGGRAGEFAAFPPSGEGLGAAAA